MVDPTPDEIFESLKDSKQSTWHNRHKGECYGTYNDFLNYLHAFFSVIFVKFNGPINFAILR